MTWNFVSTWIARPKAIQLAEEYRKFAGKDPCTRGTVKHDCAVLMSIALSRSIGVDILDNYKDYFRQQKISGPPNVHSSKCCRPDKTGSKNKGQYQHITSPSYLKDYLDTRCGFKFALVPVNGEIPSKLVKQRGIIFLKHCFMNRSDSNDGSHIDYWNGERYTLNTRRRGTSLVFSANQVWFCTL